MKVKLLHSTPLWVIANAIRYSHDNHYLSDSLMIRLETLNESETNMTYKCPECDNFLLINFESNDVNCSKCSFAEKINNFIGKKDFDLIKRVGFKYKHESVLEFGYFIFSIDEISRACLQELARHRLANLTVKSTRYTLKELKNENIKWFYESGQITNEAINIVEKYCVLPPLPKDSIEMINIKISLATSLGIIAISKNSNDIIKYILPESYKTSLQWGINLRSLINFLELRLSKEALWEIRQLALNILEELKNKENLYFKLLMENEKIKTNYEKFKGTK